MSRRKPFEDDGRTIADMSGLDAGRSSAKENAGRGGSGPGNFPGGHSSAGDHRPGTGEGAGQNGPSFEPVPFSWRERLHYAGAALGAALLIALVFLGGLGVVIWLITLYGT